MAVETTPAAFPSGTTLTAAATAAVLRLTPAAQTYAWGALPATSLVARLAARNAAADAPPVGAATPYAELWMGTHPTAPARLAADGRPLAAYLDDQGLPGLPFLLKVLSVRTALSIQAHPNKELAARLHASNPDAYKDDNHKPEMAVAVTPFKAMCCFRRVAAIVADCDRLPALVGAFGEGGRSLVDGLRSVAGGAAGGTAAGEGDDEADAASADALRAAFEALMTQEPEAVAASLGALLDAVRGLPKADRTPADVLLLRLADQYPDDVGCFAAYLLNQVTLAPGEALFLPANEPHAYLSGDCVEVMATSDNVVRAGLTPKFKDVPVLVKMLTYAAGPPLPPVVTCVGPGVVRYTPPVKEFMLERVEVQPGDDATAVQLPTLAGGSVLVVLAGDGWLRRTGGDENDLWPLYGGTVYYLEPGAAVEVVPAGGEGAGGDGRLPAPPLLAYRAAENSAMA
ncbi:hypothetical protein MMPV_001601 [Pyropia vietnamensis]